MPEYIYTTKRIELLKERASLSDAISEAYNALTLLISGEISSYNLGTWTITRKQEDLDKLQAWIDSRRVRVDEIDNLLSGRSARKVSTCVYQNPQGVGWWRF